MKTADIVERLNHRFAIIGVGNKVVVMELHTDGGIKELWPFDEFRKLLIKQHVRRGRNIVPVSELWLKHPDGRQYDRLIYAMPGSIAKAGDRDYNGWLGFTVQPAQGDWSKNRDHLRYIICAGDETRFKWLVNWCAALIQQPGRHAWSALVLQGGQGSGKGHFADKMLGTCFHEQQYIHILGASQLTGEFNEHLSGKVLIFADESTWGGDLRAADKLKGLVTEDTVPIHRKFLKLVPEPSALHIIMASNSEWPVAIPLDDRRYAVFKCDESERQNEAYFAPLLQELDNGGRAAMLHDLLAHDVNEAALRHPPASLAKLEIAIKSLDGVQRWWLDKLQSGDLIGGGWHAHYPKEEVYADYLNFVETIAHRGPRQTKSALGTFLAAHAGSSDFRPRVGLTQERRWSFFTLAECRLLWERTYDAFAGYEWANPLDVDLIGKSESADVWSESADGSSELAGGK